MPIFLVRYNDTFSTKNLLYMPLFIPSVIGPLKALIYFKVELFRIYKIS